MVLDVADSAAEIAISAGMLDPTGHFIAGGGSGASWSATPLHTADFIELAGRSERIRTSGPCVPNTVLYQAELHSGQGGAYTLAAAARQAAVRTIGRDGCHAHGGGRSPDHAPAL